MARSYSAAHASDVVVAELKDFVEYIAVSELLPQQHAEAFINLRTKELHEYCIQVTPAGYRIVAFKFDAVDADKTNLRSEELLFESQHKLLQAVSPYYVLAFAAQLSPNALTSTLVLVAYMSAPLSRANLPIE